MLVIEISFIVFLLVVAVFLFTYIFFIFFEVTKPRKKSESAKIKYKIFSHWKTLNTTNLPVKSLTLAQMMELLSQILRNESVAIEKVCG